MPEFSIIIPTYNRASIIGRAIESVLAQSINNWELIIVDDGSTDGTRDSIEEYLNKKEVVYTWQEHAGASAARNTGIELASGDYLIFLDSDDKLDASLLKELKAGNYNNYDMIFWYVKKIFNDRTLTWKATKLGKMYNGIEASFLSGSVCYRKEVIEDVGGFDPEIHFSENYELGMRISQRENNQTLIIPKILMYYYVSNKNLDHPELTNKLTSLKHLLQKHKKLYLQDSFAYSRLIYQIGFINENLGNKKTALGFYRKASKIRPLYWKPLVKRLIFLFKKIKGDS